MAVLLVLIVIPISGEAADSGRPMGFWDILLLPRVWMGAIFCLIGLGLLMKSRVSRNLRLAALLFIFFVFSVVSALPLGDFARGMGPHPSPVCTITKPFLFLTTGRGVPVGFLAIFTSIAVLSVVGNKLFCGWVCPVGALQELFYRIPLPRRWRVKPPFKITNAIRVAFFAAFIVLIFSTGISIYDYFNPFEFLHWTFPPWGTAAMVTVLLVALFMFRPFCYWACPIGLFTWAVEHVSLIKVKLNKEKCSECHVCTEMSPCPTVQAILQQKASRPDCHACGRCLELCPEEALKFGR